MNNDKIEAALERIVHESPYNGPIVAQAYRDLLAGAKLFGVPTSHYHRFLSLIEQESAESGKLVLARVAKLEAGDDPMAPLIARTFKILLRHGATAVPLVMFCPAGHPHIDEDEWATKPHKTHQCQHLTDCGCGEGWACMRATRCRLEWRPAEFPTVGVRAPHTFDASCPCKPEVVGDEVRHR